MARVYAAADIGSNTAHLLVAATNGELVMRIDNMNEWIALGETVARLGEIPSEQADRLVQSVKEFKRVASARAANGLYIFATEAVRIAKNHKEVLKRIKSETGVTVEIISPRREAELSFHGISLDSREHELDMLWEVGGGSAQVGVIQNGRLTEEASLPLGTGRVIAESGLRHPCPPDALEAAKRYIEAQLDRCPIRKDGARVVVCGGVARGLWRALHPDGEKKLNIEEVDYLAWATARLTTERIIERFSVKSKRAGTLLSGALVYGALMHRYGVSEASVSEFGVREGAILEMSRGNVKAAAV